MAQIITPGVPKMIEVTVLTGQTSGTAYHYMGTTPKCSNPNPDQADGATGTAWATADDTQVTVHTDVPVSADIKFTVMVIV